MMKKLIFSSLLLSTMMLGSYVNAEEMQNSFNKPAIVSENINTELEEQYKSDNRKDNQTFEEYVKFQEFLSNSSEMSINTRSAMSPRAAINGLTGQRKQIVDEAYKHIGKPYTQEQGKRMGPNAFDCSGLTYFVFKQVTGRNIGSWTVPQESSGTQISVSQARPGDLLFWGNRGSTYHVAIYIGNNQYIHAPTFGQNVQVSPIWWNEFPPSFALRMDLKEENEITNQKKITKTMFTNKENGAVYDSPYVEGQTKRIDLTDNFVGKQFNITEVATTSKGTWYKGSYTKNGNNRKGAGWIKSTDLSDVTGQIKLTTTMFVGNEKGAVYDSPYVEGQTKRIDLTDNFVDKEFNITEAATTARGLWYKGTYKKNGSTKTGWIKDVDLTEVINQQKVNKTMVIVEGTRAVYDNPYVEGQTKRIDLTDTIIDKTFHATEVATTAKGLWYKGTYEKNGEILTGWIKSTDLIDLGDTVTNQQKINKTMVIVEGTRAVYDSPYVEGQTKRIDLTDTIIDKTFYATEVATTARGKWYKGTYGKNGEILTGWIKSTDVLDSGTNNQIIEARIIEEGTRAIYDSPYVEGQTKRIDLTNTLSDKSFYVIEKETTSWGEWYKGFYIKSNQLQTGWIKSTDFHNK